MIDNLSNFNSSNQIGNKWFNLLRLHELNFFIPKTFVLDIDFINEVFVIRNWNLVLINEEKLIEKISFLDDRNYIFRSSTIYEDSDKATFAWIFESVISSWKKFTDAIFYVLNSYLSENALSYGKINGIDIDFTKINMAILIQEFIDADYSWVARIWKWWEIIEFSKNNNLSITSANWDSRIYIFDSYKNIFDYPEDFDYNLIKKNLHKAKEIIYSNNDVLIEWSYVKWEFIFLQIRPLKKMYNKNLMNISQEYLTWEDFKRYTSYLMESLWFSQEEWIIHLTWFSLSFKYLTNKIYKQPNNRTFTIILFCENNDKRLEKWIKIKNIEYIRVIRPRYWENALLDFLNSYFNLDYTFSILHKDELCYYVFKDNEWIYNHDVDKYKINIFSFYSFDFFKNYFDKNIFDYKKILKNIVNDRKIILYLLKNIEINQNLVKILKYELYLNSKILDYIKSKKQYLPDFSQVKSFAIKWNTVLWTWILHWIAILKDDIDNFIFDNEKNYFYVSYDFEPFYIKYVDKLSWMILARWSYLCHWVAVCEEIGLPVICDVSNIWSIHSWDKITINFWEWIINKI